MKTRAPLLFAFLLFGSIGCGSSASTSTNITAPASTRCEATVTASTSAFGPAGGTGALSIGVARECSWRVVSAVNWITFTSSVEGQGDATVGFRVAENADPIARQTSLSVADRPVSLSQQAAPCRFTLGAVPSTVAEQGGQVAIDLGAHAACAWTAASETAWATVAPSAGSGDASLRVTVAPNSGSERPVTLMVAGQRVSMTQRASAPTPTPAPAPTPTPAPTPPPPSPTPTPPPGPTPPPPPPPPPPNEPPPGPGPLPPVPVTEIELRGTITQVSGACPNWTFVLDGRVVFTTADTTYQRGSCQNIKNLAGLRVEGWVMSDTRIRADRIRYEDEN